MAQKEKGEKMVSGINKIYEGDTLTILKTIDNDLVDMGVTSPPYNKGERHKGWLVKNVKYDFATDRLPEEEYQKQQIAVLNEIYRITKAGGSFFYNHKIRWERGKMLHPMEWLMKTEWNIRQEIIWDRMIAANIRGWRFWQVDERIYWLTKPKNGDKIGEELKSKHALLTSVWRFPPERKNGHPAPFPLALPTRAIYSILDGKNGLVLDPYAGSGTTLVAAKLLGANYIGIEISKDYIKDAKARLVSCEKERPKLQGELDKHMVRETFEEKKANGKWNKKERAFV